MVDNRINFVCLFIGKNHSIYHDGSQSLFTEEVYSNWRLIGYDVKKWNSQDNSKYLYFYKSRIFSRVKSPDDELEYIVVPSLKNPRWIVLNKKDVINNHGLIIKPTSLKARVVWGVAKLLNRINLFTLIFPERFIANKAEMGAVVFSKKGYQPNILYTGAVGEYQKFSIQYCDEYGEPSYFLKIANSIGGIKRIENERKALEKLKNISLEHIQVPNLCGEVKTDDFFGIIQKNILDNEKVSTAFLKIDILAISDLYNQFGFQEVYLAKYLDEIGFQKFVDELPVISEYFESKNDVEILVASSHGDYIPWNRFASIKKVKLIDWETFKSRPLFYDVCYFIMHQAILVDKASVDSAISECYSRIDDLLPNISGVLTKEKEIDVSFYMLVCLLELYLHYKRNNNMADRGLLEYISACMAQVIKQQV